MSAARWRCREYGPTCHARWIGEPVDGYPHRPIPDWTCSECGEPVRDPKHMWAVVHVDLAQAAVCASMRGDRIAREVAP